MSEKERAQGPFLGVECELGARPDALFLGLDVSQLVSRVCCPLKMLLEWRDTCRDLGEWSDSDHYSIHTTYF